MRNRWWFNGLKCQQESHTEALIVSFVFIAGFFPFFLEILEERKGRWDWLISSLGWILSNKAGRRMLPVVLLNAFLRVFYLSVAGFDGLDEDGFLWVHLGGALLVLRAGLWSNPARKHHQKQKTHTVVVKLHFKIPLQYQTVWQRTFKSILMYWKKKITTFVISFALLYYILLLKESHNVVFKWEWIIIQV